MLKIERASVMNFDNAIRGARNPMNSWAKSDSYYDGNGNFVKKEDYYDCMSAYITCSDDTYKVYPLTDDLIYILKNHGEGMGWWDRNSGQYIFDTVGGLNTASAWMHCCCYIPQ